MSDNLYLKNKVAIVTGAARGMGLSIAKKFLKLGAQVVSIDILRGFEKSWQNIAGEQDSYAGFSLKINISVLEQVKYMVNTVIKRLGRIDILVNAAGILYEELAIDLDEKDWDKLMNVNAKGVFMCCKYVAKEMIKQRSGKIINISSQQAVRGDKEYSAYAASKAIVLRFSQVLAIELAPYGIQVNSICPGCTDTEMTTQSISRAIQNTGIDFDEYKNKICSNLPLGRMASPEDIASLVSYLASNNSDYITGAAILITGGLTCN